MWLKPRDVAQLGSAPALGAGCRRFKSCHPDINNYTSGHDRGKACLISTCDSAKKTKIIILQKNWEKQRQMQWS